MGKKTLKDLVGVLTLLKNDFDDIKTHFNESIERYVKLEKQ